MKVLLLCLLLIAFSQAVEESDKIEKDLPGCSHWTFNAYSGYIPVDDHNQYHYVFLESQNDPKTDPLIVIFSGGPGCSSMNTMFQENGPCVFYGLDSNPIPHDNQYSWNTNASTLYIESPAGVGFNLGYQGEENSDDRSAELHQQFLINWFKAYPEFIQNDMYLNGESYVGVYVPTLTVLLHQSNLTTLSGGNMNLKGILVGNPMTDWDYDALPAFVEMAWYHGVIPLTLKESMNKNNCHYKAFHQKPLSKECEHDLDLFHNYTKYLDPLDIYRPYGDGFSVKKALKKTPSPYSNFFDEINFASLYGTTYSEYLNRMDVRDILNIPKSIDGFYPCRDVNYTYSDKASAWAYPFIKEYGYRIFVYSGDTDAVVTTVGTWKWIEKLSWNLKVEQKSWVLDDKVVGFYHQYDGLDFLIFHGAGHLVPIWMKKETHIAVLSWINQKSFI